MHDSDNNRKFAADKIRKLMKEKRYTLPEEQKDAAFAAEPAPMLLLLNLRFESYRAEHIATVESDGKIVAMLTYLSLCLR